MGCPNCNKESVITLSICPSCGAMVNDSVREELAARITSLKKNIPPPNNKQKRGTDAVQKTPNPIKLKPSPKPIATKPKNTAELAPQKDTSPTLIEFQTETAQVPEWRLQLQNAAKQRVKRKKAISYVSSGGQAIAVAVAQVPAPGTSNGSNATGIEEKMPDDIDNAYLVNALKRIQASRRKYHIVETTDAASMPVREKTDQDYPFSIAARTENPQPDQNKTSVNFPAKPRLVSKTKESEKGSYDTSELNPEFVHAKVSSSFGAQTNEAVAKELTEKDRDGKIFLERTEEAEREADVEFEEIDDFAPFALRFNSGLFDLIVGTFLSLILLSPFMLFGNSWLTFAGFLGFIATCAIVMFIYLTTTIGYFGKTFGMHLFKLEMIDINGEEYPTFHQAAVSSSIYLLSIAFFGIGFLTSVIDEEKRAAHDLASGTIIVKEF